MDATRRIVIVGAGHGGGSVAAMLRQQGFAGEVVLIGAEPIGPYHRPPLSKSLLKGELLQPLQPEDFYAQQDIELRTSAEVVAIDRHGRWVTLSDGEKLGYDVLVLATGARPRPLALPGIDAVGVHELRTLDHAQTLNDLLDAGQSVTVIGGGWIGLEVAAAARDAGAEVTVIEREARLLNRVSSPELAEHLTRRQLDRGTRVITGVEVTGLRAGADGHVDGVLLGDGQAVSSALVLIAVGAVPDDALARAAGLECDNGVVVDAAARTSDLHIYAVGDVASRPVALLGDGRFRLESIPSAIEQARQTVAAIVGDDAPAPEVPWFWSDQFDLKIQIAGIVRDVERTVVRDEMPERLTVFHLRGDRLIALEAVNAARNFVAGRHLIRNATPVDAELLLDPTIPVQDAARTPVAVSATGAVAPLEVEALPGPGGTPGEPRAIFIQPDGEVQTATIAVGMSLMEAAVRTNVPGIIAECGGTCACGTCHVVVDEAWREKLHEAEFDEVDLLEFLENRQDGSRLGCQIEMTDELDGIVVRVPPQEH